MRWTGDRVGARGLSRLVRAVLLVIVARVRALRLSGLGGRGGRGRLAGTALGTSILTWLVRAGGSSGSMPGGHGCTTGLFRPRRFRSRRLPRWGSLTGGFARGFGRHCAISKDVKGTRIRPEFTMLAVTRPGTFSRSFPRREHHEHLPDCSNGRRHCTDLRSVLWFLLG